MTSMTPNVHIRSDIDVVKLHSTSTLIYPECYLNGDMNIDQ